MLSNVVGIEEAPAPSTMQVGGAAGSEQVKCPNPRCARTFACDVCLHSHLLRNYRVRWVDAFGPVHDAWIGRCGRHLTASSAMLGLW